MKHRFNQVTDFYLQRWLAKAIVSTWHMEFGGDAVYMRAATTSELRDYPVRIVRKGLARLSTLRGFETQSQHLRRTVNATPGNAVLYGEIPFTQVIIDIKFSQAHETMNSAQLFKSASFPPL